MGKRSPLFRLLGPYNPSELAQRVFPGIYNRDSLMEMELMPQDPADSSINWIPLLLTLHFISIVLRSLALEVIVGSFSQCSIKLECSSQHFILIIPSHHQLPFPPKHCISQLVRQDDFRPSVTTGVLLVKVGLLASCLCSSNLHREDQLSSNLAGGMQQFRSLEVSRGSRVCERSFESE